MSRCAWVGMARGREERRRSAGPQPIDELLLRDGLVRRALQPRLQRRLLRLMRAAEAVGRRRRLGERTLQPHGVSAKLSDQSGVAFFLQGIGGRAPALCRARPRRAHISK